MASDARRREETPVLPVCLDCSFASGGHVHVNREDGSQAVRYPTIAEWNAALRGASAAPDGDRCQRHPAAAPDGLRKAAEELQRIDSLLARRITLDGLTRVQKIALALRVCEETDPKGAIAARYTATRGGE